MKKLFAITIAVALIFVLCSCQTADDEISTGSSYSSEPTANSQIENTVSEIEEPETSSETESVDNSSDVSVSNPTEEVSSNPTNNNTSNDTSSKENVAEQKPKEPIDFVPNALKYYYNNVFYKGVKYACTSGKTKGVACFAVVKLDANDEYLSCVYVFDNKNNEQAFFNIHNDRIYYLQYATNDDRDYVLLNDFAICSVDLSGENKRVDKKVDSSFTHISSNTDYANSKYLFFAVTNIFDGVYDVMYRYNTETNELSELKHKIGAHTTSFSVGEKVFVWNWDNQEIYEHDIEFARLKFFYTVDDPHKINSLGVKLKENGFLLYHHEREDKYLLDFSGNRTPL